MRDILICGGAGYIGSHMAQHLAEQGHRVTVFDNLSTGHREAVAWGSWLRATCWMPHRCSGCLPAVASMQ